LKRCKLIGLTGQSGAGKSTVLRYLEKAGLGSFDSDGAVRQLYTPGSACLRAVAAEFGNDILLENGNLNRGLLAQKAFSSGENTRRLNGLVHPFVTALLLKKIKEERPEVLVIDAPQLFESDIDAMCDIIISVTANDDIRLKRIISRDSITEAQARQRMNAQLSEEFFRANSDFVIENNGSEAELSAKTAQIIESLHFR
jgi:dephospho-CoA kinase